MSELQTSAAHRVPDPLEDNRRQRGVLIWGVRGAFLFLVLAIALLNIYGQTVVPAGVASWVPVSIPLTFALVLFAAGLLIDLATPNKKVSTLSGVFLGIVGGLIATYAVGFLFNLLVETWIGDKQTLATIRPYTDTLRLMLGVTLCYLGVSIVLQTQDDFRLVIPYVEFSKEMRGTRPNVLDTSALIDARIADLAATGLLQSSLIVPKFVVAELQLLADSSDRLRRARGRRGLDVVTRLQRLGRIDVIIDDTPLTARAVDQMIVELAQRLNARIVTTDLGLTRVGQIQGLTVLNLHEIAETLKPALVPGEQLVLRPVKPGEQPGQGVGYLDDGTMVVVEGGAGSIGTDVTVVVTSTMQTTAGRLVFARPAEGVPTAPVTAPPTPAAGVSRAEAEGMAAVADGAGAASPAPEAAPASPARAEAAPPSPRQGPFPSKPANRRFSSMRNPRRSGPEGQ
jgi:uncharacterized protein YacL